MIQVLSESEEMIQIHSEGERGLRSNRRLGWDSGQNNQVNQQVKRGKRVNRKVRREYSPIRG
jgi:hypothetical protein